MQDLSLTPLEAQQIAAAVVPGYGNSAVLQYDGSKYTLAGRSHEVDCQATAQGETPAIALEKFIRAVSVQPGVEAAYHRTCGAAKERRLEGVNVAYGLFHAFADLVVHMPSEFHESELGIALNEAMDGLEEAVGAATEWEPEPDEEADQGDRLYEQRRQDEIDGVAA